jgi:uncharacterized protein
VSETFHLSVSPEALAAVCARYRVRELAVFGSTARGTAGVGSDIDLLVVFDDRAQVGLVTLGRLQRELAELFGRSVDLVPRDGLKPALRDEVLSEARVVYAA